ncbi:hypothetical protein CI109_101705 [Kwoniella shandongensis]|uniref:Uncharacterized protein n=1 Tax=Kwoniella shandongensis TaxID=1734106 RepID=A0A5M6CBA5_9TREE|nr:uncharacterized protein CI109_001172 [Kwoniella shandongensis]KAA5530369.1 hypothetical protein CI109_001172 [Kwoniella shandongensis]
MSTASTSTSIAIHPPSSSHPSLADGPGGFDRTWFMGKWGVAWSTLPMWKDKKDVTISYIPVAEQSKINTTFDDLVEYRKRSAAEGSKPSTVKGVDTLTAGSNGATFDWKGSSYLFFVHSHWEVLGYGKDEEHGLEWAVTFFSKTLFTPAGIDIYLRSSPSSANPASHDSSVRKALLEQIVGAVKVVEDEGVAKLAQGGFEVPGIV